MDSPRRFWPAFTALAAAAAWFGTGLHPLPWAAWLLPLCAFIAATGAPRRWRWLPAFAALFIGELNVWNYLAILPVPIRLAMLLIPAAAFGICCGLFGGFVAQQKPWSALFVPAATWVTYEYILSCLSPHGTFFAFAYTQADVLPVLQLASLGGLWLIDLIVFVIVSGVALLIVSNAAPKRAVAATVAALVTLSGAWSAFRLSGPRGEGTPLTVALIASDRAENMRFEAPGASEAIVDRYLVQSAALSHRGAQLLVWPEHLIAFRESGADANAPALEAALQGFANVRQLTLVVGVDRRDATGVWWNEARIYSPNTPVQIYAKHRLLPGFESRYQRGTTWLDFPLRDQRLGVAICKDLDFTDTGRAYGQKNIGLLIVPAFDFTVDGWLHSRMALLRAIENGFALARSAKTGRLTVADSRGRVLAETRSDADAFASVSAVCPLDPSGTLYSRAGDWAAWLAILVSVGAVIETAWTARRKKAPAAAG